MGGLLKRQVMEMKRKEEGPTPGVGLRRSQQACNTAPHRRDSAQLSPLARELPFLCALYMAHKLSGRQENQVREIHYIQGGGQQAGAIEELASSVTELWVAKFAFCVHGPCMLATGPSGTLPHNGFSIVTDSVHH